jgi:hypothetical protein
MLKFSEFVTEGGYHVPVVSISKDKVDLSKDSTRNEMNRNISAELSRSFTTPYGGWLKVSRVLEMYNVFLPKVIFEDDMEGEEIVALSQFGDKWGAELNGTITSPNHGDESEFYLYYSFGIGDSGFYECYASVVEEEELIFMLDGDENEHFEGPEGELDPRQPE